MANPAGLRVGTQDGLHDLGPAKEVHLAGEHVRAVTRWRDEVWAATGEGNLWRETAQGWRRETEVEGARCLLGHTSGLLVGTTAAELWRLEDGQHERLDSFERAPTRDEWFTPWGGPPAVRSMDAATDGTLYVNVHVGGVLRSDDGGASWQETIDLRSDVHQVIYHPQTSLLLAACGRGLARSDDGGANWQYETEGLHGTYLRAVAVAGEALLVTASDGPHGGRAAVYRKRLATDEAFERCRSGLPDWFDHNLNTHCLIASGSELALGSHDGRVFTSQDQGENWENVAEELPRIECLAWG